MSDQESPRYETHLLGGEAKYTRTQIAERAGIELERAQRLWVAMGFATNADPNAVMFTDADADALSMITGLVDKNIIEQSMEVAIARTLGQSMSRLAEWQVGVVNNYIGDRIAAQESAGGGIDPEAIRRDAREIANDTVPVLEKLQSYVWRRHLAAVSGRSLAAGSGEVGTSITVVGFADMVGYTSLTRQLDIKELTTLLEQFESVATNVIARGHGAVIKNVGDEVMFQAPTPIDAARIGLRLHEAFAELEDIPDLRVGLAVGPVLARFGDVYGTVVNIAARLTSSAHPGTVLVDEAMGEALADEDEFYLKSLRPLRVRGYRKLKTYALRWDKGHEAPRS